MDFVCPPGSGPVYALLMFGVLNSFILKGRVKFMCSRRCPWWRPRLGSQGSSSMRGDPGWVVLCRSSSMRGGIYSKKTQDDAFFLVHRKQLVPESSCVIPVQIFLWAFTEPRQPDVCVSPTRPCINHIHVVFRILAADAELPCPGHWS